MQEVVKTHRELLLEAIEEVDVGTSPYEHVDELGVAVGSRPVEGTLASQCGVLAHFIGVVAVIQESLHHLCKGRAKRLRGRVGRRDRETRCGLHLMVSNLSRALKPIASVQVGVQDPEIVINRPAVVVQKAFESTVLLGLNLFDLYTEFSVSTDIFV